ncbi:aldo/keto reductase [Russula earlei]|uniref:Aldo/keto reductase n=1 Tax=Russula earlei TaxID=71964 RepID=A0ACC0TYX6_9AGAM|nr:aldo/keto reductase [Russula earlei]
MSSKTARLGGTASNVIVGKIGHGLMMMTWRNPPVSDEEAFASLKAGMDDLPPGTKMFLNSGEFYGINPPSANLELLARFFERNPSYADKAFLSILGCSEAALERKVNFILAKLRGTKRLDLIEPARIIHGVSIEQSTRIMAKFIAQSKFDHIGLSEVRADHGHPVSAVEIEVSPWSYTQETKDVISTCEELGIAVIAYSPLGHGFLAGKWRSYNDLENTDITPADNMLRQFSRFQRDNFNHNLALASALNAIATKKGITAAQLCIAWVSSLGPNVVPIPGSSYVARTLENCASGNIELTAEDLEEISNAMSVYTVRGTRY